MIDADTLRRVPGPGRYLFRNPVLRGVIGGLDAVLETFHRPSPGPLAIRPGKILVCNQAHIGDAILATSVLPVLRAAFPEARIGFLVHPGSAGVLADHPDIAWAHCFSHWRLDRQESALWRKLARDGRSRFAAVRDIRAIGYDLALDLYPYFPNSIPLLFAAGIPLRLGWTSGGCGGLLTHALDWSPGPDHVVDHHRRLLGQIAACREHLPLARPRLHASETLRRQWRALAEARGIPAGFVAFHVGAGGVHRHWPGGHWRELAALCLEHGLSLALLGHGPREQAVCREVAGLSGAIHDLSGQLSWRLMTEAIGQARLLVGLESASGHIAAARAVPSVSIYSGTAQTSTWRPYHPAAKTLVHPVPCSPCHLSGGCPGMECVQGTTPAAVFAEIVRILAA